MPNLSRETKTSSSGKIGKTNMYPVQLTTRRIGNHTAVDPYSVASAAHHDKYIIMELARKRTEGTGMFSWVTYFVG